MSPTSLSDLKYREVEKRAYMFYLNLALLWWLESIGLTA